MVLVILAILAAILVPALLGWIDKAKDKQYVLDARNVYLATQTVVDEKYAAETGSTFSGPTSIVPGGTGSSKLADIKNMADVSFDGIVSISYEERTKGKGAGAIESMSITNLDGEVTATLGSGTWTITKNP